MCLRKKPVFRQSGPNEGAGRIADLVFGSSDYEAEKTEYFKAITAEYAAAKKKKRPVDTSSVPNWRTNVKDCRWPGMPIYVNPVKWNAPKAFLLNHIEKSLWIPQLLEDMIFRDTGVIDSVLLAVQQDYHTGKLDMYVPKITRALNALFLTKYKEELFRQYPTTVATFEAAKPIFVNYGAPLIAEWCLESLCVDELEWAKAFAAHSELIKKRDWQADLKSQIEKAEEDKKLKFVTRADKVRRQQGEGVKHDKSGRSGKDGGSGQGASQGGSGQGQAKESLGFSFVKRKDRQQG